MFTVGTKRPTVRTTRIIHHGYLLIFEGRSCRVEPALMRQEIEGIAPKTKVFSKNIS